MRPFAWDIAACIKYELYIYRPIAFRKWYGWRYGVVSPAICGDCEGGGWRLRRGGCQGVLSACAKCHFALPSERGRLDNYASRWAFFFLLEFGRIRQMPVTHRNPPVFYLHAKPVTDQRSRYKAHLKVLFRSRLRPCIVFCIRSTEYPVASPKFALPDSPRISIASRVYLGLSDFRNALLIRLATTSTNRFRLVSSLSSSTRPIESGRPM